MRIVVDTNVLIAGLVAEGLCRDIVKRRLPACEVVTSRVLLNESGVSSVSPASMDGHGTFSPLVHHFFAPIFLAMSQLFESERQGAHGSTELAEVSVARLTPAANGVAALP